MVLIQQHSDHYELWKNQDHVPIGNMMYKNVGIEWGIGKDHNIRIRRILYPAKDYSRAEVDEIATRTANCPYGLNGVPYNSHEPKLEEFINQNSYNQFINKKNGSPPMPILDLQTMDMLPMKLRRFIPNSTTGWADRLIGDQMSTAVLPQFYAKFGQMLTSSVGSDVGSKVLNGIIGFLGLIATHIYGYKFDMPYRLRSEALSFFGNFASQVLQKNPTASFGFLQELEQFKNAIRFGTPQALTNLIFKGQSQIGSAIRQFASQFKLPIFGANTPIINNMPVLPRAIAENTMSSLPQVTPKRLSLTPLY